MASGPWGARTCRTFSRASLARSRSSAPPRATLLSVMPNLLATEPSAYLKSAAHQPVHWHAWGDAAFTRARTEDKPILLDIGAVWCHWCHVMDGESYEDARVADLLNADFV